MHDWPSWRIIPFLTEKYEPTHVIQKRFPFPRPAPWMLRHRLWQMAKNNEIDCKIRGTKHYSFKRKEAVAARVESDYNAPAERKTFPLSTEFDAFKALLYRLKQGKAVHLAMDDPKLAKLRHYSGNGKRLVTLVPGPLIGLAQGIVLVSIIGAGSSLIRPGDPGQKVANLVLAGMPARLATHLMNELHQVFKEK